MKKAEFDYDKEFQNKLREYISHLRKTKKVTMDEVSDYLGVSKALYSRYEKGTRNIPLSVLKELCEYYGLNYYNSFKVIDMNTNSDQFAEVVINNNDLKELFNQTEIMNLFDRVEQLEKIVKGGK